MPGVLVLGALVGLTIVALAPGSSSLPATVVIAFLSGLPTAPFVAAANSIITEVVDPAAHARAFSLAQASHTVLASGGAAATAWAIDQAGVASVFVPGAVALVIAAWLAASVQPATVTSVTTAPA